ncbi:Phosphotransferase enzyme family protein [Arthrobacter ulcerisalmonis]|uniref:Phosphotransferase enzyme family protein n=1 Tax=Arthrobacter ulcerisalmonis TaxID=2483813 RepID=A0A3P5XHU3_9MICC|nr:phosphotransferase [Arthrobacter ulcerisalmonis]VDC31097.1 Phosphotransferase enzyme family protein [Arthrobacter ulcerisalmonis]
MDTEQILDGGNTSGVVVRVGSTVRKPWTDASATVQSFMAAVREAGVDVPEVFGRDEQGRQVIEYVPGQLAIDADPLTQQQLGRIGAMVGAIHDASTEFVPALDAPWITAIPSPGSELICHNDLAPWNLIVGERMTFIDWDAAAPSTRLWDLAYAAQAFTLSNTQQPPQEAAQNLAAFVDGYRADVGLRTELPAAMHRRAEAMHHLLESSHAVGQEPWASMYADGHGDQWRAASLYAEQHQSVWASALAVPTE